MKEIKILKIDEIYYVMIGERFLQSDIYDLYYFKKCKSYNEAQYNAHEMLKKIGEFCFYLPYSLDIASGNLLYSV